MAVIQDTIRAYQGELIRCAITVCTVSRNQVINFGLMPGKILPLTVSFTGDITVETISTQIPATPGGEGSSTAATASS